MAKRRPSLTLSQREGKLGYKVDWMVDPHENEGRFYSDLGPVPSSTYEKTRRELEEYQKQKRTEGHKAISERVLPELGVDQTIRSGEDLIVLKRKSHTGSHSFAVDIHYGFGLNLPLQFTQEEASRVMSVAKLKHNPVESVSSSFFRLPREFRDRIYTFAIPERVCRIVDDRRLNGVSFVGGIGDPSGFYFPLSKDITILGVNGQMRREALPFAFVRTLFRLDDMDDFIRLSVSIGRVGRDNIESLEFAWESRSDLGCRSNETVESEDYLSELPTLHALRCVQLLKQCKRLKFLRLYFEGDLISNASLEYFKVHPSIRDLSSVRGLETVEIWSLGCESLEQYDAARWLKEKMESPGKDDEHRYGGNSNE